MIAVTVRPMHAEEARRYVEIHHAAVRRLAALGEAMLARNPLNLASDGLAKEDYLNVTTPPSQTGKLRGSVVVEVGICLTRQEVTPDAPIFDSNC